MGRISRILGPAILILFVLLAVDFIHLNRLIEKRIDEGLIKTPSHIYGRPVELYPGKVNSFLLTYLKFTGYSESDNLPGKGEYRKIAGGMEIFVKDINMGNLHQAGFLASIDYDGKGTRIKKIKTEGVPVDSLLLGIPELGRITDTKRELREFITLKDIPPHLINAVLAAEDRRFFHHYGIDLYAIMRALVADIKSMSIKEGGSTITQQLARNFFLSSEKTLARKFHEALIALLLEFKFKKEKILELYLNQIYLGQRRSEGIYGVEEASLYYFQKHAADLSLSECLTIASLVKSPYYYSLTRFPSRAIRRMIYIAEGMVKMGFLSRKEYEEAFDKFPTIKAGLSTKGGSDYITDAVVGLVSHKIDERSIFYSGYRFYTTIDAVLQKIAERSLSTSLSIIEKRYGLEKKLQGAVVIIDNRDGGVSALVGGRSYRESQFNRATMAKRQVGSLFKPFVILSAIEHSAEKGPITLATGVDASGAPVETRKGPWKPRNFNDKKYHLVTVRKILEFSINTGAVALGLETGLDSIIETANSLEIGSQLKPYPSMILGSFTFSPIEMAYAYAAFPSGGFRFPERIVKSAYRGGDEILRFPSTPRQALAREDAYLITNALSGTIIRGTGRGIGKWAEGYISGKTGTTDEGRDSWFVAFTKDYTISVWVGFDDASPSPLTGATGALPVCASILKKLYRSGPPEEIPPPPGITFRDIDYDTGLLATSRCGKVIREAFKEGTEPKKYCDVHPPGSLEEMGREILDNIFDLFH